MIFLDVLIAYDSNFFVPSLALISLSLLYIFKLRPAPAVLGLVIFLFCFYAKEAGSVVPGTLSYEEPGISGNFSECER